MSEFVFRKAERKQAKLRLALCGTSGSGKTYSSLLLAKGIGKNIAFIDTENGSGELYAGHDGIPEYEYCRISAPFTPERYIDAIKAAEKAGFDVIIIDSLSHAWSGSGGVLDMANNATKASASKNSYYAWRDVTPAHNALVDAILQSSAHIIITMRSKTEYTTVDDGGKKKPVKIGLAPIQRDGMEYEFTVVLDLDNESHIASASKDRTRIFKSKYEVITEETGKQILEWLTSGISEEEATQRIIDDYVEQIHQQQDESSLKKVFAEAYKYAQQLNNIEKLECVTNEYNKQKLIIADNQTQGASH